MQRLMHYVTGSVSALVIAATTWLPSSYAALQGRNASLRQTQVFTVRYVCFIAKPEQFDLAEFEKSGYKLPQVFQEMQKGSRFDMAPTPEGFLSKLRAVEPKHAFQVLKAGSALSDKQGRVVINAGYIEDDPLKFSLNDNITLMQDSPSTVTLRHTGNFTFSHPDTMARDSTGWDATERPSIHFGRTYSQGVLTFPDGRKLVYAFSIFQGNIDQLTSVWKREQILAAGSVTRNRKGAVR